MGLIRDRHVGRYSDHTIEVVEDGVTKRVTLLVDGREAASESCVLPQEVVLTGTVGGQEATAKVVVRFLKGSDVSLEVGGTKIPLEKNPKD